MSRFTSRLGLTLYEDEAGRAIMREGRTQWFLTEPLIYEVGSIGSGETVTAPAFNPWLHSPVEVVAMLISGQAFITDLGSIPRIAWSLGLSPSGEAAKAFIPHDLGYSLRGKGAGVRGGRPLNYTRAEVDKILLEAMEAVGVPAWKRWAIYSAVRVGGGRGWGT